MQDCEQVSDGSPIRQGDVLKRIALDCVATLSVVVTADCDIANNKLGNAGLACVELVTLRDFMLREHADSLATRQISKRTAKLAEWINNYRLKLDSTLLPLSEKGIGEWISKSVVDEIALALQVTSEDKLVYLRREIDSLTAAKRHLASEDSFSGLDALRAVQVKQTSRAEQLKSLFGSLDPRSLPLDIFFVSTIPGETGMGFLAKLRVMSFIPAHQCFTSMAAAREHNLAFLRVGRLGHTFRHGLAQQFGMLFARIGYPAAYENDRDTAFTVIAEDIATELGKLINDKCNSN